MVTHFEGVTIKLWFTLKIMNVLELRTSGSYMVHIKTHADTLRQMLSTKHQCQTPHSSKMQYGSTCSLRFNH